MNTELGSFKLLELEGLKTTKKGEGTRNENNWRRSKQSFRKRGCVDLESFWNDYLQPAFEILKVFIRT